METRRIFSLAVFSLLLIVVLSSIFIVREGQQSLVLRLGKIKTESDGRFRVYYPGIHFKLPIIERNIKFDVRLQTLDGKTSRLLTKEQKHLIVDYFAKWRIEDLETYYTRTSNNAYIATQLLSQKINDGLRAEFGTHTIADAVASERDKIMNEIQKKADNSAAVLGIKVVDVRIKRIDLPPNVSDSVYHNMQAARKVIATRHRADGEREANKIRAKADADVTVILAEANRNAAAIKAEGDRAAARIYSDAYSQDSEFYTFLRSLAAYDKIFADKGDLVVVGPNSEFFTYLNRAEKNKDKK